MKITFTINANGGDIKNLQELGITSNDDVKRLVINYLADQIEDNFHNMNEFSEYGNVGYDSESLKFEIKLTENEKVLIDNNVISDNIFIKDFTNRKNLPKNEKIYAITDEGLIDIEEALNNDLEFDEYLIFKETGEQKGRFIDSVIDYCKKNEKMVILWVDMENMDYCFIYELTEEEIQKIKKGNLGYFVYLEY